MDQIDSNIDITCCDSLADSQFTVCCCKSDHGFKGTDCNWTGYLVLIEISSFLTDDGVALGCILDAIAIKFRGFLILDE
jgi:hypothetical protein